MTKFLVLVLVLSVVVIVVIFGLGLHQPGEQDFSDALIIQGGTLIDGTGKAPIENVTIIIQRGKIVQIISGPIPLPEGAQVIDARGKFIIPGLWDTHIHIGGSAGGYVTAEEFSPEQHELNWRAYLYNGVTAVLDMGGVKDALVRWRQLEHEGKLTAPRIFIVGPIFTAPGGHPAGTIYKGNDWLIEQATRQVTDPEVARAEVRKLITEDRVDAIKAVYDAGNGMLPRLAIEVLKAIVAEAHQHGKRVFVHVRSAQEAIDVLNAGADGIEHMIGIDEPGWAEAFKLATQKRAFWTPTLAVVEASAHAGDAQYLKDYGTEGSVSRVILESLQNPQSVWQARDASLQERWRKRYENELAALNRARAAGVRIVLGTDAGNPAVFHGLSVHRELELMVKAGYSPMEALVAATKMAAEKLGVEKELGTLEPGKAADLLILSANPLEDIRNTRRIELVLKRGVVYRREELAIKPHEPKVVRQEPEQEAPSQPEHPPTSEPSVPPPHEPPAFEPSAPLLDQHQALLAQALQLRHNAASADEFLKARELLEKAEAGLLALSKQEPGNAQAFSRLAQVQYELGEWHLVKIEPWQIQPDQRTAIGYLEAAWQSAKRAIELDEQLSEAYRLIGEAIGRLIPFKDWRFAAAQNPKAKQAIDKALQLDPKSAKAHKALGRWYFFTPGMFGGNLDKALQAFKKALEFASTDHERFLAHIWLGQALLKKSDKPNARLQFEQALAIYPNSSLAKALLEKTK